MPQWLVIGISGVTCGGKSTLACKLRDYFQNQQNNHFWETPYKVGETRLISQDDYFLPVDDPRHQRVPELMNAINFEVLSSLDMKQMMADIIWIMKTPYAVATKTTATATTMETNVRTNNARDNSNEVFMHTSFESHKTSKHQKQQRQQQHYQQNQHAGKAQATVLKQKPITSHQHHQRQQHYQEHQANQQPQEQQQQQQQQQQHITRINSQWTTQVRDNQINILIIEGFMIFNQPELLTLCNIKFHLHLPYERCYERRQKRVYDPPDVVGYFEMCVWPYYEKNYAEYRDCKDIIFLNGEISQENIFKFVLLQISWNLR